MLWDGIGLEEDSRMDVICHMYKFLRCFTPDFEFARVLAPRLRARVGLLNHIAKSRPWQDQLLFRVPLPLTPMKPIRKCRPARGAFDALYSQ